MPPYENDDLTGLYALPIAADDYDDMSVADLSPRPIPLIGVQVKVCVASAREYG